MKRYHITVGAKTTADGTVITGSPHWTIAREGDEVDCPACDSTGLLVDLPLPNRTPTPR